MKNLFLKHSKIRYSNAFMQYVLQKNISIQQGKQTFVTDVSNLKAGIYFIQIKAKEKVVDTQKLIVAH